MSKARRPKTISKGVAQAAPTVTQRPSAEEAEEQNQAQLARQRKGRELQDYYCTRCRKLELKSEMAVDKEGYYSCKECK